MNAHIFTRGVLHAFSLWTTVFTLWAAVRWPGGWWGGGALRENVINASPLYYVCTHNSIYTRRLQLRLVCLCASACRSATTTKFRV